MSDITPPQKESNYTDTHTCKWKQQLSETGCASIGREYNAILEASKWISNCFPKRLETISDALWLALATDYKESNSMSVLILGSRGLLHSYCLQILTTACEQVQTGMHQFPKPCAAEEAFQEVHLKLAPASDFRNWDEKCFKMLTCKIMS